MVSMKCSHLLLTVLEPRGIFWFGIHVTKSTDHNTLDFHKSMKRTIQYEKITQNQGGSTYCLLKMIVEVKAVCEHTKEKMKMILLEDEVEAPMQVRVQEEKSKIK